MIMLYVCEGIVNSCVKFKNNLKTHKNSITIFNFASMSDKYSILLVDDEEDILEFLSYSLEKQGYKIFTANDGNKGLMLAKKHCPDLVILDVMMPGMDGIELCDQIRQVPTLNDALIIFLTARAEDYSELAGFDAGADDYITKPVKPKLLISRIKAILRRKKNKTISKQIKIDNI